MKNFSIACILLICCVFNFSCQSKQDRPNILFIMSDDHTSQAISAYGGMLADVCPTPNIDRIANEGMLFENCFVTNSICSPSRAAIFTSKYAHKNGVYKFTALDQRQPTLSKLMQQAGYNTAFIGKYHLHSNPLGLDYFSVLPGQGDYHDPEFIGKGDEHESGWVQQGKRTTFKGHSSDAIADQAIDFLKNKRDEDKPFMLFSHFKAPHDTWEYAERYADFLEDVDIPEPANLFDDYQGRPALQKTLQYIGSEWGDHTNFEEQTKHLDGDAKKKMQYQLYMKKYLRCVKGVDDNMKRILDYLDESGLAENTVVIYTGDQGFFLGEHGLYDKRLMYEEALRMPFLVRWPGQVKKGSKSKGMILNVDFAQTILDIAGVDADPEMQGRSFVPLLKGNTPTDWRESMYYRYYYSHFETEAHYGVRTYTHKLIYFNQIDQWELYDLQEDPLEMDNVYNNPQNQQLVKDLKNELNRLQNELEDDPDDIGDNPNIGSLSPAPLHVADEVNIGKGDMSILFRFKTKVGGTLFSKCNLDIKTEDWQRQGQKTLFIRESNLWFVEGMDESEDNRIEIVLDDDLWHTVAVVVKGKQPAIYIDGELSWQAKQAIGADKSEHKFNIGAGLDAMGYMGYNFKGTISHALVYNKPLDANDIKLFAAGEIPEGDLIVQWMN